MLRFIRSRKVVASDTELLLRFQREGKADALAQLYDRYIELVYGLCLKYLSNETEAEDATMAIFESLLDKVPQHDIQHFRNWLYTFTRNHCLMQLRREKRHPNQENLSDGMQLSDSEHLLEETAFAEMQDHDLHDCLGGLKAQQKTCIEAFYWQGLSYRDIAEHQQESVGMVRSHIQNGRRNLRRCMEAKVKAREVE